MSSTKQVFKREVNPETGEVKVLKVNKDEVKKTDETKSSPTNLREMEEQLESNTNDNNQSQQQQHEETIVGNQDAAAAITQTVRQREESALKQEIDTMMAEISKARFNLMTEAFKDDIILLEYVKNGKVEQNRIAYIPMTMGMGKKVNKIGKQIRLFDADYKGMGKDKKALDVDGLRKKYPEIIDSDMDQDDIMDSTMKNEMVMNFIIKKKCQIYWGINDVDPYPLSDLLVMIGLYESRNGFAPSSTN